MIASSDGPQAPRAPAGTGAERRVGERRVSIAEYRLFSRALLMRRAFGNDTALAMMARTNIGTERAREILSIGIERRLRRRRVVEPTSAATDPVRYPKTGTNSCGP